VRIHVTAEQVLQNTLHGVRPDGRGTPTSDPEAAELVIDWLGRLRLLHGVPFEYIVADHGLLRPETIRFFHLDRNWTDALVDGALAAGTYGTRDRTNVAEVHAMLRDRVDNAERAQWVTPPSRGEAANVTGFLLRSRAVSGWPGMHIRAFRTVRGTEHQLDVMRIERLSPAVMLAMFADIPDRLEIEEPRQGIQFGVRSRESGDPTGSWMLDVRDPDDGENAGRVVPVPFRRGSAGVIHMTELKTRLTAPAADGGARDLLGSTLDSAELALQMLQYPYRQRFGGPGPAVRLADVLTTTYGEEQLFAYLDRQPGEAP